jgi:hypothetical protein
VVMGQTNLSRQFRAGALGSFTVRFIGVRLNYCVLRHEARPADSSGSICRRSIVRCPDVRPRCI